MKNNRIQQNKLYYTRQDYSKNEKKLKRTQQQLEHISDDIQKCKQEIVTVTDDTYGTHCQRVFEQGFHIKEHMQCEQMRADRELRHGLFQCGKAFVLGKYVYDVYDTL